MIDFELLEELVAFSQYGTLSATAEHLMITQPSVTRGMKRLEQILGVDLFNREVNRVTLNEVGKLAAEEAKALLQAQHQFTEKIINFAKMQDYIQIGATAPAPLIWLKSNKTWFKEPLHFTKPLIKDENIVSNLLNFKERLIITTQEINDENIESMYLGTEHLYVKMSATNPLVARGFIRFSDLADNSFLVASEIGPWKKILNENIPNANFLYQTSVSAVDELTHYSAFPTFRSNLTLDSHIPNRDNDDKIIIPLADKSSTLTFYGAYLKSQRKVIQPLLKEIIPHWTNAK